MMSKAEEPILVGMKQIQQVLGGASEATVLRWRREYDNMPMRKIMGQWTSHREDLRRWWRHLVADTLAAYQPFGIEHLEPPPLTTRSKKGKKT
jgi:hypothetical protein